MIKSLADRLFRWYCHDDFYADISGDLHELHHARLQSGSRMLADCRYLFEVLRLFRPSLLKPFNSKIRFNDTGMFKNYIKISFRNLIKHKGYTFINVAGLAIGLTAFLLINLYITFEKNYDSFFTSYQQLHRLTTDQVVDGVLGVRDAMSFHPAGRVLLDETPETIGYTVTNKISGIIFRKGQSVILEEGIVAADSNYFKLFDYKMLSGDPETALQEPNSLVLTESKARSYFGNENPVGKTIQVLSGFRRPFKVTGVIEDVPGNTHYKFDILMSLKSIQEQLDRDGWNGFNYYTYLKLVPGVDLEQYEEKIVPLARKYLGKESSLVFNVQPVRDIHLHSDFTFEPEIHGSAKAVGFLTIISVFILLIAWVNYINLSTARAIDRAKEVGLRKVIGAQKRQLFSQFLFESLLVNLLSAILALFLAQVVLPFFNQLVGVSIIDQVWKDPGFISNLLLFFMLGTIVSGFYPALVLSRFTPVTVLKGKFRNSKNGVVLRKGLVVLQYATSLLLISGTFIVYQQIQYMKGKNLGISTDYVIGFPTPDVPEDQREAQQEKFEAFRNEVMRASSVETVATTSDLPGGGSSDVSSTSGGVKIVGRTDRLDATTYVQWIDDYNLDALDMEVLAGRNFDHQIQTDTFAVIVNEAFLRRLGISDYESVLNSKVQFGRDPENDKIPIIGVLRNFHRTSLKNQVEPTVYFFSENRGSVLVELSPQDYRAGVEHVEKTWAKFYPQAPLDYIFLDDRFAKLYEEEKRFGDVFGTFSILAILIAVLGLFGLSSFIAAQRTKEVGVRKVLGASVANIITIFFKDFFILIAIAAVVGLPLIYMGMDTWLDNYAYRIVFPWPFMVAALGIVAFFTLATVGYQVYKVAVVNPSQTLRYE
ncbi:MAG: ABC transporter permease [Cyclobacteriaceae bacterium]|nr:ABC transporter permease [Cyclobacteriaceae bacterium HetDA_MAG_MS6]